MRFLIFGPGHLSSTRRFLIFGPGHPSGDNSSQFLGIHRAVGCFFDVLVHTRCKALAGLPHPVKHAMPEDAPIVTAAIAALQSVIEAKEGQNTRQHHEKKHVPE